MLLRINGHVKDYFPGQKAEHHIVLREPTTIKGVLERLLVNPQLIMAVFVNQERRDIDALVTDQDEVLLLSPVSGG